MPPGIHKSDTIIAYNIDQRIGKLIKPMYDNTTILHKQCTNTIQGARKEEITTGHQTDQGRATQQINNPVDYNPEQFTDDVNPENN